MSLHPSHRSDGMGIPGESGTQLQESEGLPDSAVCLEKISKSFILPDKATPTLYSRISSLLNPGIKRSDRHVVLDDISFSIRKGETFGIIGKNGAGKTTLLRMIAGIMKPDSGTIRIDGSMAPLLGLGIGFNGDLTAKENVFLYGALLGFSRYEMQNRYAHIIEYAGLEEYQNLEVGKFSSGMRVRLAFSIAIQIEPEILLLDEVMAVGDEEFREKSYRKIGEIKKRGTTIIIVSHVLPSIRELCDRCLFLQDGNIGMIGEPDSVIAEYKKTLPLHVGVKSPQNSGS